MKSALVVISHYNAWPTDQLVSLLDQMRKIPSGYPYRCLVVVNQARELPLQLPERHANVEILYRENTGYNIGAWEYGWRNAAPADYYLLLQEECWIKRPDWLGAFIRLLAQPEVGLVGECLAWPRVTWDRLEFFHSPKFIGRVRRFLEDRKIPPGPNGEHLQSIILGARRDVLIDIDGFLIREDKDDAICCEIAISRAVVAKGMKIQQVGFFPLSYITHPQWIPLQHGVYPLMLKWVESYAPLRLSRSLSKLVHHLWRETTGYPTADEAVHAQRLGLPTSPEETGVR